MIATKKIAITDVVLRDAHQSLFASRLRLEDMLPIANELDEVGYWSLEAWGGATFEACIRFLGEDPWGRLRELKKAMPRTPLQMLLRGQHLLGNDHYADDVVDRFVERAVKNGVSIFRVFDAMNDPRNMKQALQAVKRNGGHAQGTLSYTTSPVYTLETWLELTEQLLELGVDSVVIKDTLGILNPMEAEKLVRTIKQRYDIRLHLHSHTTTGMAEMALLKAIEAGVDGVDTAISSMSGTYGHPATEALVATLQGTAYNTDLDLQQLEKISAYFREVRKKYAKFEGQLKGADSRMLVTPVPEEITEPPAGHLPPEIEKLSVEVQQQAKQKGIKLADNAIDDVLTVALFPQIGWKFLENRGNSDAFEPAPTAEIAALERKESTNTGSAIYTVELEGKAFVVKVTDGGEVSDIQPVSTPAAAPEANATGGVLYAPIAGNIWKILVSEGQQVAEGEPLLILEAMKMETQICANQTGVVQRIQVKAGELVSVGQPLISLG